jgi:hypothetical protein
MAGLLAALRPEPQAGPSESTKEVPRKKIPKVAVYVSGATVSPLPLFSRNTANEIVRNYIRPNSFNSSLCETSS